MTGAAWHPDPTGRHELRWWDGVAWSDHVSDHGVAGHDALYAPSPPSGPLLPGTPTHPAGVRRQVWLWAAVAAVVAIGVGAGIVMTIGGDDDPTATEETDPDDDGDTDEDDDAVGDTSVITVPTSIVPLTTIGPTTLPITLPATTVSATAAPTTPAPTTVVPTAPPTTLPHVATTDDLVAALPPDTELPAGWTNSLQTPITNPAPSTSPHAGMCGGADDVARAQAHGVTAIVWSPSYWTQPDGWAGLDLAAFPTEADASAYMAESLAAAQSCSGSWTYTMLEGDGEGQYDGFSDGYGDGVVVWTFQDMIGAAPMTAADTAEAFNVLISSRFTTVDAGDEYGGTVTRAIQFERHGRVVVVVYSDGECCLVGYGGIDPSLDTVPTLDQVAAAADALRPGLVTRLATSGSI